MRGIAQISLTRFDFIQWNDAWFHGPHNTHIISLGCFNIQLMVVYLHIQDNTYYFSSLNLVLWLILGLI
jgi:hypothetical protein